MDWQPVQGAAKNDKGEYIALVNGAWVPASGAAKNDKGEYVAILSGQEANPAKKDFDTSLTLGEKIAQAVMPSEGLPQPVVDVAAGMSGTMRGASGLLGMGEGIWPTSQAKDSGWRLAGEIADPAALAIGGGVSKVIPITSLAKKGINVGKALSKNLASGATTGGIVGGLSDTGNATTGAILGGGVTAAMPVAGKLVKGTYGIGSDIYNTVLAAGGNKRATESLANKAIEGTVPESQKEKIISALLSQKPEVRGSNITAGQAIAGAQQGSPEVYGRNLVKMQNEISSMPESQDILESAIKQQRFARKEAIGRDIAGGIDEATQKASLSNAELRRSEAADALYGKARASDLQRREAEKQAQEAAFLNRGEVGVFKYSPKIDERIAALENNSVFKDAVNKASGRMNGNDPRASIDGLHMIKEEIDSLYKTDKFSTKAISEAKSKLLSAIEGTENAPGISPSYKQARETYAGMSPDVNRLKIGQALLQKLESPSGTERGGSLLSAIGEGEDSFLRTKAGQLRGKSLAEHLTPEQIKTLGGVEKELKRDVEMKNMLKNITGSTGIIPDEKIPNLLNRTMMATNYALGLVKADAREKIAVAVANKLTKPEGVAKLLSKPKSDPMRKVVDAMLEQNRLPAIAAGLQGE